MTFTEKLERLIKENISHEKLDNTYLARAMLLSESQFYRQVKQHFGVSPNHLVRKYRLEKACCLLVKGKVSSAAEAARAIGFSHTGYFIRRFTEYYGYKPTEIPPDLETCAPQRLTS